MRKSQKQIAGEAAVHAWNWLCAKYEIRGALMPPYYLSRVGRFPKYVQSRRRVRIATSRIRWATYIKKRVGAYANWIPCTIYESWTLQFVHEYTHAIQGDQKRRYSEVETTRNEIAFAQEFFPHLFMKLAPIASGE